MESGGVIVKLLSAARDLFTQEKLSMEIINFCRDKVFSADAHLSHCLWNLILLFDAIH